MHHGKESDTNKRLFIRVSHKAVVISSKTVPTLLEVNKNGIKNYHVCNQSAPWNLYDKNKIVLNIKDRLAKCIPMGFKD